MQNSNAKKDITAQTEEKLNTLESLLDMASIADKQEILEEKNDIYIYLAALRRLEERVGEKVKRNFYQRIIPSSSTEKSLVRTAKKLAAKGLSTPNDLSVNGVTQEALQDSITALKEKKIKQLINKFDELNNMLELEKDPQRIKEINDDIEAVSASIEKENERKTIDLEIEEARNNLKQLRTLGLRLKEAIAAKKNKLKQDPFFRYKFAMTHCETEEEEKDLKIIGIKLLSNPKDEGKLNEFEEQLAKVKEEQKEFKEQLAAKEPHKPRGGVPPTQEASYKDTLANAAEKEAKVIASESLTDNGQLSKLGMRNFLPPAWEEVNPEDSFSIVGANEKYHSLFEQTRTMLALFEKMEANLTAHKPNYEEYAMGFFREDTQNLQEKLKIKFENAHRQKLSSLEIKQKTTIQQLKHELQKEVREDLALFKKVGMDCKLEETLNSINNLAGYEAFCEDYKATKKDLFTKREKQKEAFFPNKTSMKDTKGVKEAINALQPVQGFLAKPPPYWEDKTIDEGLLTKINNMQSNDWKNELQSPELLLQIGDNPAHKNAYRTAMILHCDAVIEILKKQSPDIPPNYKTFLNDYFPLLPGEKLIQFFDLASSHLEVGTKRIVMDAIESHLDSKSADYLEELLKKTINVTLFDKIKSTLLIKTVNEKAREVAQRTRLYRNIEKQLTNLKSMQLLVEIKGVIKQLDALIANAPYKSPESIEEEQKKLIDQLNALVDINFIDFFSKRPVYTDAKNNLKSIIEQKIITPHINAVKDIKDIIAIQQTKIEQSPPTETQARSEPTSADIVEGAMAEISEPITSKSIAKDLLSTEKTIKETEGIAHHMQIDDGLTTRNIGVKEEDKTEETIKETEGIAHRVQIDVELTTINKDVEEEENKKAIQAVQKSILYFSGKAEIISSEHRIKLVQQYKVVCKKYPYEMVAFGKKYPGEMVAFGNLMPNKPPTSPIIEQAIPTKIPLGPLKERMAKRQRIARDHRNTLPAKGEVIPGPKPGIPGKGV